MIGKEKGGMIIKKSFRYRKYRSYAVACLLVSWGRLAHAERGGGVTERKSLRDRNIAGAAGICRSRGRVGRVFFERVAVAQRRRSA
jgi:hypothetical protein